ncbi:uncharacterized protein G2W53_002347 [Senna tora]|uniref:Uncharacterized protein n=1 Tax=Senna tora TaxID=362788 RepID=A0A834XHX8_9FABA|nr:uncharacterized protein G2W53_002347 [Senna tora]
MVRLKTLGHRRKQREQRIRDGEMGSLSLPKRGREGELVCIGFRETGCPPAISGNNTTLLSPCVADISDTRFLGFVVF